MITLWSVRNKIATSRSREDPRRSSGAPTEKTWKRDSEVWRVAWNLVPLKKWRLLLIGETTDPFCGVKSINKNDGENSKISSQVQAKA